MIFALINFIIVIGFNIYWICDYGVDEYLSAFFGIREHPTLTIVMWIYTFWGIGNLTYIVTQI